eukprot:CFRG2048T1
MGRGSVTRHTAGSAKKQGGGGKYTWGNLGDEYLGIPANDRNDPNFSDEDAMVENANYQLGEGHHTSYLPDDFRDDIEPIIKGYFTSGDSGDVSESLQKIGASFVKAALMTAICLSMERHRAERELTSCLITDLCFMDKIASSDMVAEAFMVILYNIDELKTDVPEAAVLVGRFIARAVADDVIPPAFVKSTLMSKNHVTADEALNVAHKFLNIKHGYSRLDNVWGVDGARIPLTLLREKFQDLLNEFILSNDIPDLEKSVKELSVPHFNHELVYQSLVYCIEVEPSNRPQVTEKITKLIGRLEKDGFLSDDQINTGLARAFADIEDISLDVPEGKTILKQLTRLAVEHKWATNHTVEVARRKSSCMMDVANGQE